MLTPAASARLTLALIAASLLAACASTPQGPGPAPPGGITADGPEATASTALFLAVFDANQDFAIAWSEIEAGRAAVFERGDSDHDGRISGLEFQTFAATAIGDRLSAPGRIYFDADLDGMITPEEFENGLKAIFAPFDTNADGRLTRSEIQQKLSVARQAGRPPRGGQEPLSPQRERWPG